MADYIEREALLEAIDKAFDESPIEETTAWMLGRRIVKNFPTANVEEVRHGRWIEDGDVQICSECGEEHEWADYRAPYCDICGAKMDGKENQNG